MNFFERLKPKKKFDDYNVAVYLAAFPGSAVPEIGARHRKKFKVDENFEIVAMTRGHGGLPDWYKEQIEELLQEQGLKRGSSRRWQTMLAEWAMMKTTQVLLRTSKSMASLRTWNC